MFPIYRTTLSAFCLALILPCSLPVVAEDAAQKPTSEEASQVAAVLRHPLPERSQEDALALERQLPSQEQQALSAGNDNFLALWKPANSPDPLGAVVIVPGAGETADWPQAVGPLRRKLPDARWHSLSLTLPDLLGDAPQPRAVPPEPAPPTTTALTSQATPPDAAASVEQATAPETEPLDNAISAEQVQNAADAERIFARIEAGIAYAQQQKARTIVLLGHGSGAYWAARYLNERQPPQVQKLVMVAAQTPAHASQGLDTLTPALKLPTADFFYSDRPQASQAALQRLQANKRAKDSGYSQVSLKALPGNKAAEQEQLFRRIRGWLGDPDKTAF